MENWPTGSAPHEPYHFSILDLLADLLRNFGGAIPMPRLTIMRQHIAEFRGGLNRARTVPPV